MQAPPPSSPTGKHYVWSTELYLYQCGWDMAGTWFRIVDTVWHGVCLVSLVCLSGLGRDGMVLRYCRQSPACAHCSRSRFPRLPLLPRFPVSPFHTHLAQRRSSPSIHCPPAPRISCCAIHPSYSRARASCFRLTYYSSTSVGAVRTDGSTIGSLCSETRISYISRLPQCSNLTLYSRRG